MKLRSASFGTLPRPPSPRGTKRSGDDGGDGGGEDGAAPSKRQRTGAATEAHAPGDTPPAEILHKIASGVVRQHGYRPGAPKKSRVREAGRRYGAMAQVNRHWHQHMAVMLQSAWHTYLAVHIKKGRPATWGIFPRVPPVIITTALDPALAPPIFAPIVPPPGVEDLAARVDGLVVRAFRHGQHTMAVLSPLLKQVDQLLRAHKLDSLERERLSSLPHTVLAVACLFGWHGDQDLFQRLVNLVIEHIAWRPEHERRRLLDELQLVMDPQHWRQIQDSLLGPEARPNATQSSGAEPSPPETALEQALHGVDSLKNMVLPLSPRSIARIHALATLWENQRWTLADQPQLHDGITTLVARLLNQLVQDMGPGDAFNAAYVFEAFCPELMAAAFAKLARHKQQRLLQGIDVTPAVLPYVVAHVRNAQHPAKERRRVLDGLMAEASDPDVREALRALWREQFPNTAL